ncbi:MAG: NADH:ubiquinone oxidoreductase subunit J [Chloroflexi bacterium]|nr:NADH:ubiquinone oxidoreductase subunit J [Chloroflexota bacterium]|tara:strand:- start:2971 stop:3570 length:600 start_codon:yes stop_codon:yes gene_type:complete
MTQIIFYIFGAMLLLSATMVVVIKNPIHAALFLVLSFFSSAAIWLLLNAEFLAIALVLVYVGAVMVLFLFVVMMLDINLSTLREGFARYFPLGIVIAFLMVIIMGVIVSSDYFVTDTYTKIDTLISSSNTKLLGYTIYTNYLYQFEIAGAILLVAIIAAISLSMSKSKITKSTHPDEQVTVKKEDRLRVIKMKTEKQEE